MRRLVLISSDHELERHLSRVMGGICDVACFGRGVEDLRRAAAEGAGLIAIDSEMAQGAATVLTETITNGARIFPGEPILVLGDEGDAPGVLRAIRAGARDVISRSETATVLRTLLARHLLPAAGAHPASGQLHLVLNSIPGASSLYAINLAVLQARAAGDGLLIDCTLPASHAGAALDIKLAYTVADAVQDMERIDRVLLQSALAHDPASGLRVLPLAATSADTVDRLSPEDIISLVQRLLAFFPATVLDAGGVRHLGTLRSLAGRAAQIHLVAQQTIAALHGAHALLDRLEPDADMISRTTLTVDPYDPAILLTPDQMAATLGLDRIAIIPAAHAALANALNAGVPLVLAEPRSAYARAIAKAAGLDKDENEAFWPGRMLAGLIGRLK